MTARCSIPGCPEVEPGVGTRTCVIWGQRRLCYASHFPLWVAWQDEHGDRAPTDAEWATWARAVTNARAA